MYKRTSFLASLFPLLFLGLWLAGCDQTAVPPTATPTAEIRIIETVPVDPRPSPTATTAATPTPAATVTPVPTTPPPQETVLPPSPPPQPTINCPNPATDDMVGTLTLVEDGSVSIYTNPVLGIEITSADKLCVHEPDYLFSTSYGFTLSDPEVWEGTLFSANWLYQAAPDELETIVQELINSFPDLAVNRAPITVDGWEGVMLWPLPGTDTTTQIYLVANDRLYHLIFWTAPLDNQAQTLLDRLHFIEPTQSLESLNLPPAQ